MGDQNPRHGCHETLVGCWFFWGGWFSDAMNIYEHEDVLVDCKGQDFQPSSVESKEIILFSANM